MTPQKAVGSATATLLGLLLSIIALIAVGAYGADECAASAANCEEDDDCRACLNAGDAPTSCATTAITCDGWWDMACCTYGTSDACLNNSRLLSHLQCRGEGNDCIIDGICPGGSISDGSVVRDVSYIEDTACMGTYTNCINDSECQGCVNEISGDCSAETITSVCDEVWERLCCTFGTNAVCQKNEPLIAYTACLAGLSGCTTDGVCPDGRDGAEAVGAVDGSDDEGNEVAVDVARSSGDAVTLTATSEFALPMVFSGVAVFLEFLNLHSICII
eukprot:g9400.t1